MSEREQKSRELMEQLEKLPPKAQEHIGYMIEGALVLAQSRENPPQPGEKRMKGGKKVEEETKKPCTPVEEAGRDYNELGLYLHSKENNRTLEAAQTLWEFLPGWMAARKMAVYDPDYNRSLSGVIAENAEIILKAAQDMAGWGLAECEPARKEETPQG